MPATKLAVASGHTTKLNNNNNNNINSSSNNNHIMLNNNNNNNSNMNNSLCNSIAHLSDSRTNLTVNTPTACQRLRYISGPMRRILKAAEAAAAAAAAAAGNDLLWYFCLETSVDQPVPNCPAKDIGASL
ncbi:hypothetical protein AWZ03_007017 [Drosophila navojoa]|uniref:Uncharacterized protein n=1 Tax=Drosophila navojoa TaxID=7232 RepID=A0A484BCY8_DRONA|nr:hypothetical protein AWZ03_007017 [Drosophila navojoa]